MKGFNIAMSLRLLVLTVFCLASFFVRADAQAALTFQPGTITSIAGNGVSGFSAVGGPAIAATLTTNIKGVVADNAGDVFFVDGTNCTVRVMYELLR